MSQDAASSFGEEGRVAASKNSSNSVFVEVHYNEVVTACLQVLNHVAAHKAKADESDCWFCHFYISGIGL